MNYIEVNVFSTEMFGYVKFLEYGWNNFDKTDGTLCQKIMSKITLLYGVKDEFYYEEVIAPMIPIKYRNIKPNFQNTMRDVVMGEFMSLVDSVITMN